MLNRTIRFFLENQLVAYLLLLLFVAWGLVTAPFDFGIEQLPRDPVSVDAIPDIGENQQIVFTKWMGQSPQDVEDQISYPLTTALLGIPGVKSIRSNSMFGFSSIYVIFEESVEFYWSRSRILEKLNSLPPNLLPEGIQPTLGPDATALGQIFWYTLEGQDADGHTTDGWGLHELRSIQDYYVRYGLSSAEGVSEVASIGGYVKEYQVEVDPDALRNYDINLQQVMQAVKNSNVDIGAQTIEINLAEYFVRGIGYIEQIEDIEQSVITSKNNIPIRIQDVAHVNIGPATRRGVLDKSGAEVVGGVVVARYGANPLEVIEAVKVKIQELQPGLPSKELSDGRTSQVHIVPFYDRSDLIKETIGTLEEALTLEMLITVIVVILLLFNLKASILVTISLPIAVLMCFIAMKYTGVDANIVALSGIAIAIGTMVDMGIVLIESITKEIEDAPPDKPLIESIYEATVEVASAVITAVATTVISFLPVFTMQASEGKLFRPLAFTKTFALIAAIVVAIVLIPTMAHSLFSIKIKRKTGLGIINLLGLILGGILLAYGHAILAMLVWIASATGLLRLWIEHSRFSKRQYTVAWLTNILYAAVITWILATTWMPLGVQNSTISNFLFVVIIVGGLISSFYLIIHFYENILRFLLRFKLLFLLFVGIIVFYGFQVFQQTGKEFMPALDEGSFLLMPTSMPHAGMEENIKNLRLLDMAVTAIPEVESTVGKAGRVESALDPAPMNMYENVILYKTEYKTDENGHRVRFRFKDGDYIRDKKGTLIPDKSGRYFRQWRDHIRNPNDIWEEIVGVTKIPGVTSAPKLQPIETRLVMLQTGMRAPMGIKVRGTDLKIIEDFGVQLETALKEIEGVKAAAVFADRIVGKPYLLLDINRTAIARYGLTIQQVQQHIQVAVGGMTMTNTVEGRERYAVKIRYPRALRSDPEAIKRIEITAPNGQQVLLGELIDIQYEQGAQAIKSEDGFLVGYVLFDKEDGYSEVEVIENAQEYLQDQIDSGALIVPKGINYRFAGNYEQQLRADKRLSIVLPIALLLILLILYFQFKSLVISLMVFTGVFIAFSGGFLMIGWYNTDWFLNFNWFDTNMRDLFQVQTINLSVAVWVGFLALFGIATDDGVLVATFLQDSFKKNKPDTIAAIRSAVVEGGLRRVRPAMMTTATTILALLPILTSTGRGSDIMIPMAIPSFGGMTFQMITMFTVPVLYALWEENKLRFQNNQWVKKYIAISLLFMISGIGLNQLQAQSIDSLTNEAIAQNLELQAIEKEHKAILEETDQVRQLPDMELGLGVFPLPVETRLGAQLTRVSALQMLPWFGSRDQKVNLVNAKAAAYYEQVSIKKLNLKHQIQEAYYQLYQIQEKQVLLQQRLDLLQSLEQLALTKVENGTSSIADVLQTQMKITAFQKEIKLLEIDKIIPISSINKLLYRDLETPVQTKKQFQLATIPYTKTTILEWIEATQPRLKQYDLQQAVAQQNLELNAIDRKPSLGVGLDYILVNGRSDADPTNNGRDIVQLKGAIRISLGQKKYEAKNRQENLRIAAINDRKIDLLSVYQSKVEQLFAQQKRLQEAYDLYQNQKATLNTIRNVLQTEYSAKGSRFDELLQLEQTQLDYDFKILQTIVQSHILQSNLERLFIQPKKNNQ